MILLSFGAHDYAIEILEAAREAGLASAEFSAELSDAVKKSLDYSPLFLWKSFAGVLFAGVIFLASLPVPSTRPRAGYYLKQRSSAFFRLMLRRTTRSGPSQSCISE